MDSRARLAVGLTLLTCSLAVACAGRQRVPVVLGADTCTQRLLIAAPESEFKNAVITGLVERVERDDLCIEVIDVVHLPDTDPGRYAAMVLVTDIRGQMRRGDVDSFVERLGPPASERAVMLVTAGTPSIQETELAVDAVTAASELAGVEALTTQLSAKVEALLEVDAGDGAR